jgi:hypothetical protein
MAGPSKMCESDEECYMNCCKGINIVIFLRAYIAVTVKYSKCENVIMQHGINVDLEHPSNPLEYIELFCTPEIAEQPKKKQYA